MDEIFLYVWSLSLMYTKKIVNKIQYNIDYKFINMTE